VHSRMVTILKVSRQGVDRIMNSLQNSIENTTVSIYSLRDIK